MGEISNIRSEPRSIPSGMDRYIANYKADGAIGGGVAFAVVGDHENRPTDMTNLVVINDEEKPNSIQPNKPKCDLQER